MKGGLRGGGKMPKKKKIHSKAYLVVLSSEVSRMYNSNSTCRGGLEGIAQGSHLSHLAVLLSLLSDESDFHFVLLKAAPLAPYKESNSIERNHVLKSLYNSEGTL